MKTFKKIDVFLILAVILITVFFALKANSREDEIFLVKLDGKIYTELKKPGYYPVKDKEGEILTIVHYDGENVWVTDSTCPLKICEKTGKIKRGGKIICVPNKIVIESQTQELQTW
jgi:hypothetical protein